MDGVALIAAERWRQIEEEGWTPEHDDGHPRGDLAAAAACYAMNEPIYVERRTAHAIHFQDPWPWEDSADKRKRDRANFVNALPVQDPEVRVRMLARAGALLAAEIDRIQRRGQ